MTKKFGVVILNFNEYNLTKQCVDDFVNVFFNNDYYIVVVDNNSTNNSYDILKKYFAEKDRIQVIGLKKNIGFARGNNEGYFELIKHFDPDFVIFSNSDIRIKDTNLPKWIISNMEEHSFSVLGPSIYSINGNYFQNPINDISTDRRIIRKSIRDLYISYIKLKIKKVLHLSDSDIFVENWQNTLYRKYNDNITLHGSFQIFSKIYFKHYSEPYDPSTFLYMEENILRLRCLNSNIRMVYSPSYCVEHLQGGSTSKNMKVSLDKKIFRVKNMLLSTKAYYKLLKK